MASFFDRLKERKLFQWALAYAAGAWALLEGVDLVGGQFGWPTRLLQSITILVAVGFFVVLVLAWYHGEKGQQKVTGFELFVLAVVLGFGGLALSRLDRIPAGAVNVESTEATTALFSAASLAVPAVAVLPFAAPGTSEDEEFADGVHEEVLHALAQLSGLIVKSRQSVMQYRGSELPITTIAEELDADAVLEGSVRSAAGRVRVTVQLIDARNDNHLWSRTYDETLTADRLFEIQEAIAREVAWALEVALTPPEEERLANRPTTSLDAQVAFQRAMASRGRSPERERLLRLAIEMDSTFDRPWAALSRAVGFRAYATGNPSVADSALALAEKAIAMNPLSKETGPYHAIGLVRLSQGRLSEARDAFEEGFRRMPSGTGITNNLGRLLREMGQYVEAAALYQRAIRLAPANTASSRSNLADLYAELGLHEKAERAAVELETLHPGHDGGWTVAYTTALRGDPASGLRHFDEWTSRRTDSLTHHNLVDGVRIAVLARTSDRARYYASRAHALEPDHPEQWSRLVLGYLNFQDGDSAAGEPLFAEAQALLEGQLADGSEHYRPRLTLARIEAVRGNTAEALHWLDEAYEAGFLSHPLAELDPMFDSLRGDPAFDGILARMRADVERMRDRVLEQEAQLEVARQKAGG